MTEDNIDELKPCKECEALQKHIENWMCKSCITDELLNIKFCGTFRAQLTKPTAEPSKPTSDSVETVREALQTVLDNTDFIFPEHEEAVIIAIETLPNLMDRDKFIEQLERMKQYTAHNTAAIKRLKEMQDELYEWGVDVDDNDNPDIIMRTVTALEEVIEGLNAAIQTVREMMK